MIRKFFKKEDSTYEIRLIVLLLVAGNIAAVINSGIIDLSTLISIGEIAVVLSAVVFLIKLSKEYKAFIKKKQTA